MDGGAKTENRLNSRIRVVYFQFSVPWSELLCCVLKVISDRGN